MFVFATVLFKLSNTLWNSFPSNVRVSLCNFSYTIFRGLFKMFSMCSLTRFEVLTARLLKFSLMGY